MQQKIFREAYTAEGYLETMDGVISKYDNTWIRADALRDSMMLIIYEMGWRHDYDIFCKTEDDRLGIQAL